MNTIGKPFIQDFTSEFEKLRSSVQNPDVLAEQGTVDPNLRTLARNARAAARPIEQQINAGKIHLGIEKPFLDAWRDWTAGWRLAVVYLVGEESIFDHSSWPSWPEFRRKHRSDLRASGEAPEDGPWEFDPSKHNGSTLLRSMLELNERNVESMLETLIAQSERDTAEHNELDDAQDLELAQQRDVLIRGLSAAKYLEDQMGFDLKGMFDRWNKVPAFLVPVHIKPSAASRANGTLFDLLNDAIKAYVAGAPAAAMAICRSALEIVVKEHYLEGKSEPQWNLDHCINVAAARYRFLDQEKMHKHRRRANEVMHSYESASWFVDESDPVIPFIKDLRHWIEKAPDRHRA